MKTLKDIAMPAIGIALGILFANLVITYIPASLGGKKV